MIATPKQTALSVAALINESGWDFPSIYET
jgi:hypothetical protein